MHDQPTPAPKLKLPPTLRAALSALQKTLHIWMFIRSSDWVGQQFLSFWIVSEQLHLFRFEHP